MHTHTRGLRGLSRSVPSGQGASVAHLSGLCKPCGITSRLAKAPLCQQWVENHASQVELLLKNPPVDAGDVRDAGLIAGWEDNPGGRIGYPLQCSCLENPMDRGAWWATVNRVSESDTTEAT